QNYKNFEIIVVDNNSTDDTVKIVESAGVKLITEKRKGVGFARQAGFLAAKGEIVATTDADTILPKDWISRIVSEFKKDKNLAAFGGLYTLYSGPITAKIAISFFAYPVWYCNKVLLGGWSLPGVNFAIRRDSFLKIGGFNTELRLEEDVDISQRLRAVGKVKLDPDFLVQTSGRRYRNGLLAGIFNYYHPSNLARTLLKKNKFKNLSDVRVEKSLFRKLSFLPFLLSLLLLFGFFYSSNPNISQAKSLIAAKNKLATAGHQISVKEKKIKNVLVSNIKKVNLSERIKNF
ncbi:MAG: glycosyltransferase, partial [bacterium]|nr:glycosyltransferase [bacterium]